MIKQWLRRENTPKLHERKKIFKKLKIMKPTWCIVCGSTEASVYNSQVSLLNHFGTVGSKVMFSIPSYIIPRLGYLLFLCSFKGGMCTQCFQCQSVVSNSCSYGNTDNGGRWSWCHMIIMNHCRVGMIKETSTQLFACSIIYFVNIASQLQIFYAYT